jgi:hypothetical protein
MKKQEGRQLAFSTVPTRISPTVWEQPNTNRRPPRKAALPAQVLLVMANASVMAGSSPAERVMVAVGGRVTAPLLPTEE